MNEWKFKEAYMKYKCGGEHMLVKEREQKSIYKITKF